MRARVANGHTLTLYVPDGADVATEGIYADGTDTHEGIFLPRRLIDDWYGSPLTRGQMHKLANAITRAPVPDVVAGLVDGEGNDDGDHDGAR